MNQAEIVLPWQSVSLDAWASKYQLKALDGTIIDKTPSDTLMRTAIALAQSERDPDTWVDRFFWAMQNGAIPAGRVLANAGAGEHKPKASTINCTVSGTIRDSMDGILTGVYEGGLTLSAGCGIGYDFSTLRPRGSFVAGVGVKTSGVLSFMNIYDTTCFTVASAGGRRGAQMGTMIVSHPNIREFISAKREDGRLRQFNLSVLITDRFMRAVEFDADFDLWFPLNKRESNDNKKLQWHDWPYIDDYMTVNDDGKVLCKVYETVKAREIWDLIMKSNYDFAEPGFILIDKVNSENNLWFCENIRASNPCGEQMLPPYGSCLLGSVNLTSFVISPFTSDARFDWDKYKKVCCIFTRMLDNVVEINGLPLQRQREEIEHKRRHGMGFLGLGSALAMLRINYGSKEAQKFTEDVSRTMAIHGWRVAARLAEEKGPAPILEDRHNHESFLNSQYLQRLFALKEGGDALKKLLTKHGARFTHHTSIAPTGTISLSFGNNASNGIEPSFSHKYLRNIIKEGRNTKEQVEVYSYEFLLYCHVLGLDPAKTDENNLPEFMRKTSDQVTPLEHVAMQAAAQPWIDSAISKTVNVPSNISFEDFKNVYMDAYKRGLKGCSTFRFNPSAFSGVLVKEDDLKNTIYVFTLEDGREVEVRGDETIEYEGQQHKASNLFDALKEGYYGKL